MNEKEDIKKLLRIGFRYRHAYIVLITHKDVLGEYDEYDTLMWNQDIEILRNIIRKYKFSLNEFK